MAFDTGGVVFVLKGKKTKWDAKKWRRQTSKNEDSWPWRIKNRQNKRLLTEASKKFKNMILQYKYVTSYVW